MNPIPSYRADQRLGSVSICGSWPKLGVKGEEKRKWGEFCLEGESSFSKYERVDVSEARPKGA